MKKCIICHHQKSRVIFSEFGIDVLECDNCGHVYSSYKQEQDYNAYFGNTINTGDHFWWNKAHEKMYNEFFRKFIINNKGKLLDVGCGLGYFLEKINSYPDWETFGCEISKPAVEFAGNKLKLKNIFCGRIEESEFEENFFDIITLWDVIEHIPDPRPLLSSLRKILKPRGKLFIHTPNSQIQIPKARIKKLLYGMNSKKHYLEAKDHINIYSPKTISMLLKQNNYNNIEFIHLPPIQSVSGSKKLILKYLKNLYFYFSVFIYFVSLKKINVNNLFVIASK